MKRYVGLLIGVMLLLSACGNRTSFDACYERALQVLPDSPGGVKKAAGEIRLYALMFCAPGNR